MDTVVIGITATAPKQTMQDAEAKLKHSQACQMAKKIHHEAFIMKL